MLHRRSKIVRLSEPPGNVTTTQGNSRKPAFWQRVIPTLLTQFSRTREQPRCLFLSNSGWHSPCDIHSSHWTLTFRPGSTERKRDETI